jgi:DUF4097 and DUF4098 domain-containing protein YvlB
MREVFHTPGHVALSLRVPEGDIEVETEVTEDTIVELTGIPDDELVEIARIDSRDRGGNYEVRVEIREERGLARFFKSRELRLRVQAPDGADVSARGGSADVRGRGRFGTVAVDTGSGDIEVDAISGDAAIKSGSGDVRLEDVAGDAVVSTGSGDIEIGHVARAAQLRSASGDVRVGEAGTDVTVQTASGDQQIDAVTQGQVTMQSASGDLHVGIRRGSRLAVDARSLSGDTTSEIDLDEFEFDEAGAEAPLVELRATAMSGDIHVSRA